MRSQRGVSREWEWAWMWMWMWWFEKKKVIASRMSIERMLVEECRVE